MNAYLSQDSIAHYARTTPQKEALIELPSGRRLTYSEANDRADKIASWLVSAGVKKGDRVAFLAFDSIDILLIAFAVWRVGGILVALNFRLTADELADIIADSEPVVVFLDDELLEVGKDLRQKTEVSTWVQFDGQGNGELENIISEVGTEYQAQDMPLDAPCMLMYSSGTTGHPKGIIITHGMLVFSHAAGIVAGNGTQSSVSLSVMPLFHIAGMNVCCLPFLTLGGSVVVIRKFEPETVLDTLCSEEFGVTHFFAIPAAFNALRSAAASEERDYSRIVSATTGAESVPDPLINWWLERGVFIQEGYGMTETAGQGCLLSRDDVKRKRGSAGKALVHSEIKIMNTEGAEAEIGESGEIWIRGNVVTPGYWNQPEKTQESFHGRWFKTGDIGKRDADGFIYIEDRLKDMYISGGENVFPAEVENVLYQMPQIQEVAVIGAPDARWGEIGCAAVVLVDGQTLELEEVHEFCSGKLAKFKWPMHLAVERALPRNATGKVQKQVLRERLNFA